MHLKEYLDDGFLASFENELGFPDVHVTSRNAHLNKMGRFSQCWTFLLPEIEAAVPSKMHAAKNVR